jgi:hypothetical protein
MSLELSDLLVDTRNILLDDEGQLLNQRSVCVVETYAAESYANFDGAIVEKGLALGDCEYA